MPARPGGTRRGEALDPLAGAPRADPAGLDAAGAGSLEVAVSGARDRADATALFASLQDFTSRHVGLPLVWRGELEGDGLAEAMCTPLGERHPAEGAQAFIRRLRAWSSRAGVTG